MISINSFFFLLSMYVPECDISPDVQETTFDVVSKTFGHKTDTPDDVSRRKMVSSWLGSLKTLCHAKN